MFIEKIIKYALYIFVFIFPLFFLPLTADPLTVNKQILLAIFVLLAGILWLLKTIFSGKISFRWNIISTFVLIFLIILAFSAFFSKSKMQSFWGMDFEADSFLSFFLYAMSFFIFSFLAEKKDIFKLVLIFISSLAILSIFFLAQIFAGPFLPWEFARISDFNPIGSGRELGIFLAAGFLSLICLEMGGCPLKANKKNRGRQLFYRIIKIVAGISIFSCLVLVNFHIVWIGLAIITPLILWCFFKTKKTISPDDFKKTALLFVVLGLSLIFLFINIPINRIAKMPIEVGLNFKESVNIAKSVLGESDKNLLFGSGPATFGIDYDLYHSPSVNLTEFWQIRFGQAGSFFLNLAAIAGISGAGIFILIILAFIWSVRSCFVFLKKRKSELDLFLRVSIFGSAAYFFTTFFLYSANLTVLFSAFFLLGLFLALEKEKKEIIFIKSPQMSFIVMLCAIFLIVGTCVGFQKVGKIYAGAINYDKGMNLKGSVEGIAFLNKAFSFDKRDSYFRRLSQEFLFVINGILADNNLSPEEKTALIGVNIRNAEAAADSAISLGPEDSRNFFQKGAVYENLAVFDISGARTAAVENYQQARNFAPYNPQIPYNIARIYKKTAEKIGKESENYEALLEVASQEVNKSIELKSNFIPAIQLRIEIEKIIYPQG